MAQKVTPIIDPNSEIRKKSDFIENADQIQKKVALNCLEKFILSYKFQVSLDVNTCVTPISKKFGELRPKYVNCLPEYEPAKNDICFWVSVLDPTKVLKFEDAIKTELKSRLAESFNKNKLFLYREMVNKPDCFCFKFSKYNETKPDPSAYYLRIPISEVDQELSDDFSPEFRNKNLTSILNRIKSENDGELLEFETIENNCVVVRSNKTSEVIDRFPELGYPYTSMLSAKLRRYNQDKYISANIFGLTAIYLNLDLKTKFYNKTTKDTVELIIKNDRLKKLFSDGKFAYEELVRNVPQNKRENVVDHEYLKIVREEENQNKMQTNQTVVYKYVDKLLANSNLSKNFREEFEIIKSGAKSYRLWKTPSGVLNLKLENLDPNNNDARLSILFHWYEYFDLNPTKESIDEKIKNPSSPIDYYYAICAAYALINNKRMDVFYYIDKTLFGTIYEEKKDDYDGDFSYKQLYKSYSQEELLNLIK